MEDWDEELDSHKTESKWSAYIATPLRVYASSYEEAIEKAIAIIKDNPEYYLEVE